MSDVKFKKHTKEFLLTDSSLNSYKYRLLTSGYLMAEFKKNPIGYYMHGTKEFPREMGVLVRWDDLRMEGDKVYGKPCINMEHPRGERTYNEIENGFLNAASVGSIVAKKISQNQSDYLPDQEGPTVIEWFNRECSLVDVPGNYNALTDLVDENYHLLNLADFTPQFIKMKQIFLTPAQLAMLPNLKADGTATQDEVNTALNDLVAKANKVDSLQTQLNTLTASETTLKTEVANLKAAGSEKEVADLLNAALNTDKKITANMKTKLAETYKGNPSGLKDLLAEMPTIGGVVKNLKDKAAAGGTDKFEGKTYSELDEAGLLEDLIAADENKFFDLFQTEYNKKHKNDNRA